MGGVDHVAEFDCYEDEGPDTCEVCIVRSANGDVLAALGCIDDADENYRREIERELLDEARAELASAYVDTYARAAKKVAA